MVDISSSLNILCLMFMTYDAISAEMYVKTSLYVGLVVRSICLPVGTEDVLWMAGFPEHHWPWLMPLKRIFFLGLHHAMVESSETNFCPSSFGYFLTNFGRFWGYCCTSVNCHVALVSKVE